MTHSVWHLHSKLKNILIGPYAALHLVLGFSLYLPMLPLVLT